MAKSTYFRIAMAAELTIAVALGMRAYAQTPATTPAAPEQGGQLPQITVTGYIIPRVGGRTTTCRNARPRLYREAWRTECSSGLGEYSFC